MSLVLSSNFQWVFFSSLLLGAAAGAFGSISYWKRQSLMSDALAHAALPGVVIAFMIVESKHFFLLIVGAAISALIGSWFIHCIKTHTRLTEDTAMGLILAVFFGGGIMLLTIVNHHFGGNQAGLDKFIFGQAATMIYSDVVMMALLAAVILLMLAIAFKEWKLFLFDPHFASGLGLPLKAMNALYILVLVLTIVTGIQAVGVILIAALLIIPPVSARYWTHSLQKMTILSACIGSISCAAGAFISALGNGWPTGPFIVVTSAAIFLISLMFGTKKGLLMEYVTYQRKKKEALQLQWLAEQAQKGIKQ